MKQNKRLETDVLQAYEAYFDSYVKGDVNTIASLLDEDYNQIGSAESEVFFNKKDAMKFLKDTIDQVAGKTEIRNRSLRVDPLDGFMLVTDLFDIYALMDTEWTFYSGFRASTLMQKKENGWKFIHQHSSLPDTRTQEGENIAIEKIAAENLQLREAVKRRTVELEQKSKKLEIEASLERVRAVAMSMRKPEDMLDVCRIISKQLELLEVSDIRNVQTAIINKSRGTYLNYQYFTAYNKSVFEETEYKKHPVVHAMVKEMEKSADAFFAGSFEGKELEKFREYRKQDNQFPDPLLDKTATLYYYFYSIGTGGLGLSTYKPIDDAELEIFNRFHKVFDMTYRRFIDIENAEAQAREAQIEAALERVRARTMAMHKSDELAEVAAVLFEQMITLGATPERINICLIKEDSRELEVWSTDQKGSKISHYFTASLDEPTTGKKAYEAWKKGLKSIRIELTGKELTHWIRYVREVMGMTIENELIREKRTHSLAFFSHGMLITTTSEPLSNESMRLMERFAEVFNLTYTRFLDLQKAEEQARESQIEAALERVRSRSMAMHKSEELHEVVNVVYEQLHQLDLNIDTCTIDLYEGNEKDWKWWSATEGQSYPELFKLPYRHFSIMKDRSEARKRQKSLSSTVMNKSQSQRFWKYFFQHIPIPSKRRKYLLQTNGMASSTIINNHTGISGVRYNQNPFSDEENHILARFANSFEQSYTRFLDLQKAEAQAREAQIEAALERVRSQAMAMHHTDDLGQTIRVYYEQLDALIDSDVIRCGAGLLIKKSTIADISTASRTPDGEIYDVRGTIDMVGHPLLKSTYEHWQKQEELYYVLRGNEIKEYYQYITNQVAIPDNSGKDELHFYFPMFNEGSFYVVTECELPEEELGVFRRFSTVLSLTYRRFSDLKKAEEQAREAEIETALERIRARALAMHSSKELTDVARVLREQMGNLNQPELAGCVIHLYPEDSDTFESWFAFQPYNQKKLVSGSVKFPKNAIELTRKWIKHYHSDQNEYSFTTTGKEYLEWIKLRNKTIGSQLFKSNKKVRTNYYHMSDFSGGTLITSASEEVSKNVKDLQKKAAAVFDLAYKRYLDLQAAEDREKETIKQASLDRVRGQIASMRSKEDLNRIIPVIWEELTHLEVPFIRCGVFIINKAERQVQVYLSTPSGKSLATIILDFDEIPLIKNAIDQWEKNKVYREEWDQKQFETWTQSLIHKGKIKSPRKYRGSNYAPEHLVLHFIPFNQGMLYVGSKETLSIEQVSLAQSLADSFSVAYARYEDFIQLEKAKTNLEMTLEELRSTQSQLIHSEKMASLGELTAGIAHEIQNPLNFVNNFSEVNSELVEELLIEIKNGNLDEIESIVKDIYENENKIRNHGQRAEGIVRGMLQHSRGSEGKKEPTDINMLADEYIRLAFHGMRARDKSFNAKYKLELDETLPKINVVPQDIGRVLLNLINNAFFAVSQKLKAESDDYKPEVIVTTKKLFDSIEIRVKDNGAGIPDHIRDKIFQPFFTTKPTGQGTGLGLSLSYDIITKGHEGTIEFVSKECIGTEFYIHLPIKIEG